MHVRRQIFTSLFACFVLCSAVLLSSAPCAWAQSSNSGTVTGTVTDPSGAVVNGATVTLTDASTKTSRSVTTNDTGRYIFVDVQPDTYELTVGKQGFSTSKTQTAVKVGVATTANMTLQVGGSNVVVEVTAVTNELQTMNSTVGNTITGVALESLPTLGRDVSTFLTLQPGISPDGSVAGAAVDQSYFSLDGGNNTNDMDGSMSVYTASFAGDPTGGVANQSAGVAAGPTGVMPTPADSVEEFKTNTANQTADFNSSAGAEVKVVTKRGTNAFHGSVYEYYLDNNFSANTWDNNFNGTPLASFHYSRFGGAFGGPLIPKEILGGKTYFFANYEGFRYPNSATINKMVPSPNMRNGILQDPKSGTLFNLLTLDPRGIGISPSVQKMWQSEPASNAACALSRCDGVNVLGFAANVAVPLKSDFGVVRMDHDFGAKWHFMSSYRFFKLTRSTIDQIDIGGALTGDKIGVPSSASTNPQEPWYLVAGLTTNITSNVTNDIHYSFLRNWWQWGRAGDVIQVSGLGGALEPFGESRDQVLSPYNVNTQQTRTRFWDGKDHMFRDDLSMLKGNHLFQIGGIYQHNFNWHQRTDNGGGINYQPVYQLGTTAGAGTGVSLTPPAGWLGSSSVWGRDAAAVYGIVSASQIAFTRSGPTLTLNPPLTPAFDQSTIPYYNVYFSDTWHMKPSFTLTYGLGWTLEMPPVEKNGKQVEFVDQSAQPIDVQAYMASRKRAALLGQVFNPDVGFALVGNTGAGLKYPYNPFYGEFSPRIAAAWNPRFDNDTWMGKVFGQNSTVIRGGYGRIYGRLNGVDLVLVPLLGTGLIQPVQCFAPTIAGACGGTSNINTAFRVGVDGLTAPLANPSQTLPQPDYPGINAVAAGAGEALDPHFRPNVVDSFDLTIQRQLSKNVTLEFGYIGRRVTHEYQPINVNAVPYMMTIGGQRFDKAYANLVMQYCGGNAGLAGGNCAANLSAVTEQPFFQATLTSTYCNTAVAGVTPTNCAQAVALNEGSGKKASGNLSSQNVWGLWSDLDSGGFDPNVLPRSMMNTPLNCPTGNEIGCGGQLSSGVGINASIGYGNYNAGFVTVKMADWKGFTAQSNFTWSKALGTGSVVQATSADTATDPFNLGVMYGKQAFDRKFVYTMFIVYQPPFFKGQSGVLGRVLGGWTFAPLFAAGSGQPLPVGTINSGGSYGEGDSNAFSANGNTENAVPITPYRGGNSIHYTAGSPGFGDGGLPVNLFANPAAVYNNFRNPILGMDTKNAGWGVLTGLPYWNLDMSIKKQIRITERIGTELQIVFTNVLNHAQLLDPTGIALGSPGSFGNSPGEGNGSNNAGVYTPRAMEFGVRVRF
jgi:Carboxypeptidase regulatory-like domain